MFNYLKYLVIIFLIVIIHIFIVNFLPYPFNNINFFLLSLLLLLLLNNKNISWLVLTVSFLIELFTGTPFGVTIISVYASFLLINWFLKNIFTNRSVYIIFLSSLMSVIIFRIFFFIFLIFSNLFFKQDFFLSAEIIINMGWEALFTAIVSIFFYYLIRRYLNPIYIDFRNYGQKNI